MKEELINVLFEEFEKDKEIIKKNLLQYMDTTYLETSDKYGKLTMSIIYRRKDNNETENS